MNNDLKIVYSALIQQVKNAKINSGYYSGNQPLMYTHERLREVFERSSVNFIQNWCAVVIDSAIDRIVFKGWNNPVEAVNNELDALFHLQNIQTLSRQVHKDALITGDGFMMVDVIDGETKAFYNSPNQVIVLYEEDDPMKKAVGGKSFYDSEAGISHFNLYYPDRIEKYEQSGKKASLSGFELADTIPNPFGAIPIIHFNAKSELTNVIPLQDAINKTFSDMMIVAEFNAFPQRWMITNADISSLVASPRSIMRVPKGATDEENTSIGEFGTANLGMYLDTIDKLTNAIAVISRTPKHYFQNTGANISGEALEVMETPLIKKVNQLIETFSERWVELAGYLNPAPDTTCVWDRIETQQISTQTTAMKQMVEMGVPLITILRKFGWGEDEITQMVGDMEDEKARKADLAEASLALAIERLRQSPNPYLPETNTQTITERGEAK